MNSKISEKKNILKRLLVLKEETSLEVTTEILRMFSVRQSDYEFQMKNYINNNDFDKIKFLAHNLKSTSANIGAVRLPQICQWVEDSNPDNRLLPFYLRSMFSEYKKTKYFANEIMDQLSGAAVQ